MSARNAIAAASLGSSGFTANAAALENPSGYFRAFDRGMKVSFEPFDELGHRYDIVERGFKPKRYPCGGLGHTSIDATLELRNEVRASDIAAIKTGITKYAASRIGDKYPTSVESAKFSMPYVAAYTVLYGPPMLKAFTEEAIRDEKIKEMARKVSIAIDPEFADLLDDSPSRVTVTLTDGRTVRAHALLRERHPADAADRGPGRGEVLRLRRPHRRAAGGDADLRLHEPVRAGAVIGAAVDADQKSLTIAFPPVFGNARWGSL